MEQPGSKQLRFMCVMEDPVLSQAACLRTQQHCRRKPPLVVAPCCPLYTLHQSSAGWGAC